MSGTLNKVMLIGHTGDDVKMHHFEGGGSIGKFSLATNESYTKKDTGEKVTKTEWHQCIVRNKGAEICEKYLKKGDKVYVEGRIGTRKWTDDKGIERYSTEINVLEFTFLTPKNSDNSSAAGRTMSEVDKYNEMHKNLANSPKQSAPATEEEDDLPF